MDFFEAVRKRRSVRAFAPGEVPDEDLQQILDAGRRAPSGWNYQPRHFIAVTDPDLLRQALQLLNWDLNCPALIAVVMEQRETPSGAYWIEDACAALENMLLAATALGYGACWVQGGLRKCEREMHALLELPEDLLLLAVLPIGKPAEVGAQAEKRALSDVVHRDTFGKPWE